MKLIGIIDSSDFKEKLLSQRALLIAANRSKNAQTEASNEQINDVLLEIRVLLNDIENK